MIHDTGPVADEARVHPHSMGDESQSNETEELHMSNCSSNSSTASENNQNCDESTVRAFSSAPELTTVPLVATSVNFTGLDLDQPGWNFTAGNSTGASTSAATITVQLPVFPLNEDPPWQSEPVASEKAAENEVNKIIIYRKLFCECKMHKAFFNNFHLRVTKSTATLCRQARPSPHCNANFVVIQEHVA